MKKILLLLALFIGMSSYSDTVIVENSSSYDAHLIFTVRNADCENPFMLYTLNVDSGSNNSIYLPSGIKPKSVNILLSSDNCSSSGNAGGFRIGSPNSSCNGYSCTSSNYPTNGGTFVDCNSQNDYISGDWLDCGSGSLASDESRIEIN